MSPIHIKKAVYCISNAVMYLISYGLIILHDDIRDTCSAVAGNEHQKGAESTGQTSRVVPELPQP